VKISCPACSAKYSIADDKVQDRLAKIRCRKCGATIVIDGKTSPPNVYTSAGDASDVVAESSEAAGGEYSVDFGEGDQRTLSLRDLITAYNSGQVSGETYVWAEGFSDWKPLADVTEIVDALNAGSAAAPAAAPSPWDKPAAAARSAASATGSMPRAAARAGSRSATADLFGGIDTAGSEDDVATSAPEQHAPIGTPSSASATGQRNESSVLFSLSALTSAAQSRPSTRPSATSNGSSSRDDSGLIDLKALTAAATKTEATGAAPAVAPAMPHMAPISPLGVAPPLGLSSPLGQVAAPNFDYGMPQQKSKAPLFIGGGLAIGLLGVAAAILLKPEPPPPPPPAPVVVAAPPAAPFVPTPTAEPVAKPPATGTGDEPSPDASAKTAVKKRAPSGGGGGVKKSGGSAAPPAAGGDSKPAAPPPKKSGGCGCAPSDLLCNMKCSSK
jgi:predicted Zn finger-like uncharacterized protein